MGVLIGDTPRVKPVPQVITELDRRSGYAHTEYEIIIPDGYVFTELEIITRCDNRTFDLTKPAGQKCHFGGSVTPLDNGKDKQLTFRVRVHED